MSTSGATGPQKTQTELENGPIESLAEAPAAHDLAKANSLATHRRIETGIVEAAELLKLIETNPVAALMLQLKQGHPLKWLLPAINRTFAVVKYGNKTLVAAVVGKDVDFMKPDDFHNMLANLIVRETIEKKDSKESSQKPLTIQVSKLWFKWSHRRQYVGRGVVFEPGGPLAIPKDMLNIYRGFGVKPKQGDWSLMRNHIRDVICSGNDEHFQYLIKWMAYGVQHLDRPIGVAIALRGEEGAGKGFLWRNYGKLFGKHFKHLSHGEHLTGKFNAALAEACAVFLDEALWAGDRKGEQILKALVTEDTFQLERKFCDPIPVKNRLRIMIASNNQWIVPVSTRGRRYCVLDVGSQFADEKSPAHKAYWDPLQAQFGDNAPDDGRAAMLYDLLHMDLSGFNVRDVPKSAAKTEQKLLTLRGTEAWLLEVLQDGAITTPSHGLGSTTKWGPNGLQINVEDAYEAFKNFSHGREYRRTKEWWSRDIRHLLKDCVSDGRPRADNPDRKRKLTLGPLDDCRKAYARSIGADDIEWDPLDEAIAPPMADQTTGSDAGAVGEFEAEWEPEYDPMDECYPADDDPAD
jgi:hypothetical protein